MWRHSIVGLQINCFYYFVYYYYLFFINPEKLEKKAGKLNFGRHGH